MKPVRCLEVEVNVCVCLCVCVERDALCREESAQLPFSLSLSPLFTSSVSRLSHQQHLLPLDIYLPPSTTSGQNTADDLPAALLGLNVMTCAANGSLQMQLRAAHALQMPS